MQALDDDDTVGNNHSTSGCIAPIVEDGDDLDFENWDGDDLRSTDTATRTRRHAYGDTGYGNFQKQPIGDTASIYRNK
jgi:hypothetical protein